MGWYILWPIDDPQQVRMQIWNGVAYYKSLFHVEPWKIMVRDTVDENALAILQKMGLSIETIPGCKPGEMMLLLPMEDKKHDKDFYNDICNAAGLDSVGDGFVKEVKS